MGENRKKVAGGSGGGMQLRSGTVLPCREGSRQENPLLNPLVLESVFKYLNIEQLKVTRQVSRFWRDCSEKEWRSSGNLVIMQNEGSAEKYDLLLKMLNSNETSTEAGDQIMEFWVQFCASVKNLTIGTLVLPSMESFRRMIFISFPSLTHLNIRDTNLVDPATADQEPPIQQDQELQHGTLKFITVSIKAEAAGLFFPWRELFMRLPHLEGVCVQPPWIHPRILTIFETINEIRDEKPYLLNLKQVSIRIQVNSVGIPPAVLATITDRRLRLEKLELGLGVGARHIDLLPDILRHHADTLTTLKLRLHERVHVYPNLDFPQLLKVEHLSLYVQDTIEGLEFLRYTPKVKKLSIIVDYCPTEPRQIDVGGPPEPLSDCKELDLGVTDGNFSMENFKSVIDWTPNVEVLCISGVDNIKFAMICTGWPNLVELVLEHSTVDGSGFVGWDQRDVQFLERMRRAGGFDHPPVWAPITAPRANITALQKLRSLTLYRLRENPGFLSRVTGLFGVEKLPNLRFFHFENYKVAPKDRSYWNMILEKHRLT